MNIEEYIRIYKYRRMHKNIWDIRSIRCIKNILSYIRIYNMYDVYTRDITHASRLINMYTLSVWSICYMSI